jgi:hypothetical protein
MFGRMSFTRQEGWFDLHRIDRVAMQHTVAGREFSASVIPRPSGSLEPGCRRRLGSATYGHLLWASIDNDDSRDLDQLSVAEALPEDQTRILVAIADVDALVEKVRYRRPCAHEHNVRLHSRPDLPDAAGEAFDGPHVAQRRSGALSDCVEMLVDADGNVIAEDIYRALVFNHAKLAYNSVAHGWREKARATKPCLVKDLTSSSAFRTGSTRDARPATGARCAPSRDRQKHGQSTRTISSSTCVPISAIGPRI